MTYTPKQEDIVFLNFNPQSCHEQSGKRPGLIVSNDQFFLKTKLALVCSITNTDNKFPLHTLLDSRTKTTGMILCEHIKCLDVISRDIYFIEKIPKDIIEKTILYIQAFF